MLFSTMNPRIPERDIKLSKGSVVPDPNFVLQTTKGCPRRSDPTDVYKEQKREKYFFYFTKDLKEKENKKISQDYETQMRILDQQCSELDKDIAEYKAKVSTLGELSVHLEESISLKKEEEIFLMNSIVEKENEIVSVEEEVLLKDKLLHEYLGYHTFLDQLYQVSGMKVHNLDSLMDVYSALENHCITIMLKNQELKKELNLIISAGDESISEGDEILKKFRKPVNNLCSAAQKMKSKTEKRDLDIRNAENCGTVTDASMRRLIPQINSSYKKCINNSSIRVSSEMMLAEIEHSLYDLLDAMSSFPHEKLQSTAKARRKEEQRRQQEIKLEKLKKR